MVTVRQHIERTSSETGGPILIKLHMPPGSGVKKVYIFGPSHLTKIGWLVILGLTAL